MRKLFISVLPAMLFLLQLSSCKAGDAPPGSGASPGEELVWQSKFYKTESFWWDISQPFVADGAIYFFQPYESRYYTCNLDGSGFTHIESYLPAYTQLPGASGSTEISAVALVGDGSFYAAEVSNYFTYTGEESVNSEYNLEIRLLSVADGTELACFDTSRLEEAYPGISIDYMTVTENGNVITASEYFNLTTFVRKIVTAAFDSSGGSCEISEYVPLQGSITLRGLKTLPGGNTAALIYEDGRNALFYVDENSGKMSDGGEELPYTFRELVGFTSDGAFISYAYNGLESFKLGEKESSEFINWLDCDLDSGNTTLLGIPDDNTVVCLTKFPGVNGTEQSIVVISKVPQSEKTQKKVLTLACDFLPYDIRDEILQFNKSNSEYRIKVEDYTKYDNGSDMYGGKTKLNIDMVGGNAPDILVLTGLPYDTYASRGLLEDLYPYIDADTELGGRSGITDAFRNASETPDGKLFFAASSFKIMTLLGKLELAGDTNSWTVDDITRILAQNEGMRPFRFTIREIVAAQMLRANLDAFVNWETGESSFDSPEFIKLIELVNTIPAKSEQHVDVEEILINLEDPKLAIHEQRQLAEPVDISTFSDFMETATLFGDSDVYKGYPCAEGQGSFLYLYDTIGITSRCSDKAAAWEFVRRIFGANYQSKQNHYFPTNARLFDEQVAVLMTPDYKETTDDDWGSEYGSDNEDYRLSADGRYEIPKGHASSFASFSLFDESIRIPYYAMTQEQYERFTAFMNNIDRIWNEDQTLSNIVTEELEPYFAGQKDAESAAKIIQSRAQIYVAEQR